MASATKPSHVLCDALLRFLWLWIISLPSSLWLLLMDTGRSKSLMSEYPIIAGVILAGSESNGSKGSGRRTVEQRTRPGYQSPITDHWTRRPTNHRLFEVEQARIFKLTLLCRAASSPLPSLADDVAIERSERERRRLETIFLLWPGIFSKTDFQLTHLFFSAICRHCSSRDNDKQFDVAE